MIHKIHTHDYSKQRWRNSGRSIKEMTLHASTLWRQKSYLDRRTYHELSRRMIIRHRSILRQIKSGGPFPYNWKQEMLPAPVAPEQPPAAQPQGQVPA